MDSAPDISGIEEEDRIVIDPTDTDTEELANSGDDTTEETSGGTENGTEEPNSNNVLYGNTNSINKIVIEGKDSIGKLVEYSYNISPSSNGLLHGYTSSDASSSTSWTNVDAITSTETNGSIFTKLTTMVKNIRYLYYKIGTTSFSSTEGDTISEALSNLQSDKIDSLKASSHYHTADQLPISNVQVDSDEYIPTSKLIYSMQDQIDAIDELSNGESGERTVSDTWSTESSNYKKDLPSIVSSSNLKKVDFYFSSIPYVKRSRYTYYSDTYDIGDIVSLTSGSKLDIDINDSETEGDEAYYKWYITIDDTWAISITTTSPSNYYAYFNFVVTYHIS